MISSTLNSLRHLRAWLYATFGTGAFSFVYEYFSHEVYSPFMVYLFTIPLVLGVLPYVTLWLFPKIPRPGPWQHIIHTFAIITLITGSALQGIVEIYGTTSQYIIGFFWSGLSLLFISLVVWIVACIRHSTSHRIP